MESIYILYSEIYYEPLYNIYVNILTLNKEPDGQLKKYTKHIRINSPSTKEETLINTYCTYAISSNLSNNSKNNNTNLMTLEQLDDFTQFIINNNYIINNNITQLYKDVLYNNKKKLIYAFMLIQ
jgi:hypothetical protein